MSLKEKSCGKNPFNSEPFMERQTDLSRLVRRESDEICIQKTMDSVTSSIENCKIVKGGLILE